MPGFRDAEELERETDRLIADREAEAAAAERRRQANERAEREATARQGRDNSLWIVQNRASNIAEIDELLAWWRAALRNWKERNRGFLDITATEVALFALLMASPFAVATLDYLMLSYVGREIAKGAVESFKGIGGNGIGWIVLTAVLLFTLGYVVVELVIGGARDNERLSRDMRRRAGQLAVMLWITLPLFIVIFSLFASGVFSADPAKTMGRATLTAAIFRAALFGVFAMAIHGYVLWFGSAVVNAYGYGLYRTRRMYIERRIVGLERRRRAAGGDLESSFRDFHGAVTDPAGGAEAKVGPFSATTTRVVNATFGTEVIETAGPQQQQQQRRRTGDATDPARQEHERNGHAQTRHGGAASEHSNGNGRSQTHGKADDPEDEWPGTVYDMDGEDAVD